MTMAMVVLVSGGGGTTLRRPNCILAGAMGLPL